MIAHTEPMWVDWIYIDASGLAHYSAALRYFEVAAHDLSV